MSTNFISTEYVQQSCVIHIPYFRLVFMLMKLLQGENYTGQAIVFECSNKPLQTMHYGFYEIPKFSYTVVMACVISILIFSVTLAIVCLKNAFVEFIDKIRQLCTFVDDRARLTIPNYVLIGSRIIMRLYGSSYHLAPIYVIMLVIFIFMNYNSLSINTAVPN